MKNLDKEAVERILAATKIPTTHEIERRAHQIFLSERNLIKEYTMWCKDSFTLHKEPSRTKKDIADAMKALKELYGIFSGEKMTHEQINEFQLIFKQGADSFGENYTPSLSRIIDMLKRIEFVLAKSHEINSSRIGQDDPHFGDYAKHWLDSELQFLFEKIYRKKPTIHSKPADGEHNSPFLRFASQALQELSLAGCNISPRSWTFGSIRQRIKRQNKLNP